MVFAIITITVAVFLVVNFLVNWVVELARSHRCRKVRLQTLQRAETAEAPREAPSLVRVAVADPLASVLAVGPDPTVLADLRRALSLSGYRVDTVWSVLEAARVLGSEPFDLLLVCAPQLPHLDELIQVGRLHDSGPDIVAIQRGEPLLVPPGVVVAATLTLPLSDRRLAVQMRHILAERTRRLEAERLKVRLVAGSRAASPAKYVINVPAGLFIAPNHTWVSIQPNGEVRIGLDDFALKLLASAVDDVDLPLPNDRVGRTSRLFSLYRGTQAIEITSPIDGEVAAVNYALYRDPELLNAAPYTKGWVCTLRAARNLSVELRGLRLGEDAVRWSMNEVERHFCSRGDHRAELRSQAYN